MRSRHLSRPWPLLSRNRRQGWTRPLLNERRTARLVQVASDFAIVSITQPHTALRRVPALSHLVVIRIKRYCIRHAWRSLCCSCCSKSTDHFDSWMRWRSMPVARKRPTESVSKRNGSIENLPEQRNHQLRLLPRRRDGWAWHLPDTGR